MFAVIKTGGKQYKVAAGDVIRVEKLAGDAGEEIEFGEVLLIGGPQGTTLGQPLVSGAAVVATVVNQTRGPKIIVFKKKRRQNYRRKKGHRQDLTVIRIADIYPPGAERKPIVARAAAKPAAAPKAAKPEAGKKAAPAKAAKKQTAHKEAAKKEPAKKAAAKKPVRKPAAKPKAGTKKEKK
ncbi:MAG: 50S ribosomal protein L21 [Alphaproteobacteria bacterium]